MNKMDKLKKFLNVKYLTLVALIVLIIFNVAQMLSKSNTVDKKNTTEKSTKQEQTEQTKPTDHSIRGTGIYSLDKISNTIYDEAEQIIQEVRKDNTIKPNLRESIAIKKCTNSILNNPYLQEQYDYHLNRMVADIQKECQDAYTFYNGLIDILEKNKK